MEQNQSSPSPIALGLIVLLALIIDILQFVIDLIPVVGWVVNVFIELIAGILLWFCLKKAGVNTKNFKQKVTFGIGFIANLIPYVGSIASWTVDMIVIIIIDKAERKITSSVVPGQKPSLTSTQRLRQSTAQNIYSEQNDRYMAPNRLPLRNTRLK